MISYTGRVSEYDLEASSPCGGLLVLAFEQKLIGRLAV